MASRKRGQAAGGSPYVSGDVHHPWYTIAWIILIIALLFNPWSVGWFKGEFTNGKWKQDLSSIGTKFNVGLQNFELFQDVKNEYEKQIAFATGDYYTSDVEKNKKEPLGVFIDELKPSEQFYEPNSLVEIWGILSAKTLADPLKISLSCKATPGVLTEGSAQTITGTVDPASQFEVASFDRIDFACKFPQGGFPVGSSVANVSAEFNFNTSAYQKAFFIDKSKVVALRRENKDPVTEYKLEQNIRAVSTNGPIELGFGMSSTLIQVDTSGSGMNLFPLIGATITNKWDGEVVSVTGFMLQVPDAFTISCPELTDLGVMTDDKNGVKYHQYSLNMTEANRKGFKDFKTLFKCRLNTSNPSSVLEANFPVTARYFRASVSYVYATTKQQIIDVRCPADQPNCAEAGATTPLPPGTPTGAGGTFNLGDTNIANFPWQTFASGAPAKYSATALRYNAYIESASRESSVDYCFLVGVMSQESTGNPLAVSVTGAAGLMQFTYGTASSSPYKEIFGPGLVPCCTAAEARASTCRQVRACPDSDPRFDAQKSIRAAAALVADNMKSFCNRPEYAAGAYNSGPACLALCKENNVCVPFNDCVSRIANQQTEFGNCKGRDFTNFKAAAANYMRKVMGYTNYCYVQRGGSSPDVSPSTTVYESALTAGGDGASVGLFAVSVKEVLNSTTPKNVLLQQAYRQQVQPWDIALQCGGATNWSEAYPFFSFNCLELPDGKFKVGITKYNDFAKTLELVALASQNIGLGTSVVAQYTPVGADKVILSTTPPGSLLPVDFCTVALDTSKVGAVFNCSQSVPGISIRYFSKDKDPNLVDRVKIQIVYAPQSWGVANT